MTPAAEAEGRAASWAAPLQVGTGCGLRGAAPGGALRDGAVAAPCVGRSAAGLCAVRRSPGVVGPRGAESSVSLRAGQPRGRAEGFVCVRGRSRG